MVVKRTEIQRLLEQLPEEFEIEDLMHELYLKAKLSRAEEDIAAGRTTSHEDLVAQVRQWKTN